MNESNVTKIIISRRKFMLDVSNIDSQRYINNTTIDCKTGLVVFF